MKVDFAQALEARADHARHTPGQAGGFYESFFQRANHPHRPLAFWTRYTLFSPAGRPEQAVGQVWAVLFDGENGRHAVAKAELPLERCVFERSAFSVAVGEARLGPGRLSGGAGAGPESLSWELSFQGRQSPLLLLPPRLYEAPLPRAKSLVSLPGAVFHGRLHAAERTLEVHQWVGSHNHNWGTRHTDSYAWGQVAGFDTHPDSFLEVATARLRLGPLWTPPLTVLVLRHAGEELALRSVTQALRAEASLQGFHWRFRSEAAGVELEGHLHASPGDFVGLRYANPPGGEKHCLNTKLAACRLVLRRKRAGRVVSEETLATAHRAAFELLTDARDHGVPIRA
jgi:hypothetical protein